MPSERIRSQMRHISCESRGARPSVASSKISTSGLVIRQTDGEHLPLTPETVVAMAQALFEAREIGPARVY